MARQDHTPITDEEKEHFLEQLAAGCSVLEASGRDDSMRRKLYRERDNDPEFRQAWLETLNLHRRDFLVHVAQSRAVDGWDEPVFYKGEEVGSIRKFDNTLLVFLIKQADPSYRENAKLEVTGSGGGPIELEHRGVKLADVLSVARAAGVEPAN